MPYRCQGPASARNFMAAASASQQAVAAVNQLAVDHPGLRHRLVRLGRTGALQVQNRMVKVVRILPKVAAPVEQQAA